MSVWGREGIWLENDFLRMRIHLHSTKAGRLKVDIWSLAGGRTTKS